MSSLFELPLEPAEGSDVTKWYYQEITANGATNVNVDSSTTLSFQFAPQGRRWFVPSRSYFRVTGQVGGTIINSADATAFAAGAIRLSDWQPAVGGAANFFQSVKVLIGGTLVSTVENRLPLVEVMSKRLEKPGGWLNSQELSTNHWGSSLAHENNDTWRYQRPVGAIGTFYDIDYTWQPPLGFFKVDHAIPGMEMTIELITDANWKKQAFEPRSLQDVHVTVGGAATAVNDTKYLGWQNVTITFHAAFVEGPRSDDSKFVLNFDEWSVHELPYNNSTNFTVRPETNLLVLGTQDSRYRNNNYMTAGRLLVYDTAQLSSTTVTTWNNLLEAANGIQTAQIEYNGQMFPAQPHKCNIGQLIMDNAINSGLYFSEGDLESASAFKGLGQMIVFQTPKDGTSYATAVGVHTTLSGAADALSATIKTILFARAPRSILVRTADSMVVTVQSADVARTDRGLGSAAAAGSGRGGRAAFGSFY